jgi:TRAP-type C4-dicarboxylate transport system permease small subunit
MMDRWKRLDEIIDRTEQTVLVISLSLMILIAFFQIVLRNLFETGLTWGDPLVRNLVLWVGFIGAALATKEGKHINIDVLSRWIPPRGKIFVEALTDLFSSFICALLTFAALKFIRNEVQMGNIAFPGIPSWIPEIILPITFGLMALRFCFRSLANFSMTLRVNTSQPQKGEK